MEHRCGTRRAVKVSVRLATVGGLMGRGTIRDVSASGALIDTALPLVSQMLIRVRGPWARSLDIEAEVVRVTTAGIAVEWSEFSPVALREFDPAIAEMAEAPPARVSERLRR